MGLEYIAGAVALFVVIVLTVYRRLTSTFDYFEKKGISGPKPIPLFGTWWGIWKKFQGDQDLVNASQYGKVYGTFDGKTPNLIVTEPSIVKALLGKESGSFRNRRAQCVKSPLLQQSLLAISNNEAQNSNKSVPTFLVHEKIRALAPLFVKAAESLRQNLEQSTKEEEGRVNVSKHVSTYLIETLALGVFGLDLNKSDELRRQFARNCDQAFLNANPDSALSLIPFLFPSVTSLDGYVMSKEGAQFFMNICQSSINERRSNEKKTISQVKDVLEIYLDAAEEEKQTLARTKGAVEEVPILSDQKLIAECLAVVLNTSVVTKNILAMSIHTLATNPAVQEKLFHELSKQSEVTYELIISAKYLNMFIDEVSRLYPTEFRLERICSDSMEIEKHKIDQGTVVSIPVFALHRNEEFYSEPDQFDPERFSPENIEKRNPATYLPYGQLGSSTGNLNVQFGILAAKFAVAYLVKRFKFNQSEETQVPPKFVNGLTGVLRAQEIIVTLETRN